MTLVPPLLSQPGEVRDERCRQWPAYPAVLGWDSLCAAACHLAASPDGQGLADRPPLRNRDAVGGERQLGGAQPRFLRAHAATSKVRPVATHHFAVINLRKLRLLRRGHISEGGAMSIRSRRSTCVAFACTIVVFAASPLLGQGAGGGQGGPRYDPATETTVTGTVEAVEQITPPGRGRRGMGGTHLVLTTGAGPLEVHLGPTAFLQEKKVVITKGDTLEILGSRVTVEGEPVFLAREVKKGSSAWTLRDGAGLPLWRGPKP
jgi:hypothetical protein